MFKLFKRDQPEAEPLVEPVIEAPRGLPFDGLNEELRLVGRVLTDADRLSDALNRGEQMSIIEASVVPLDGSTTHASPVLDSIDPYDYLIVFAGVGSQPTLDDAQYGARRVHKLSYDVVLDIPPFRVRGKVHLRPGQAPADLATLGRWPLWVPVTSAQVELEGGILGNVSDTVLLKQNQITAVEQLGARAV